MSSIFHQLSRPALESLADVLGRQYLQLPCSPAALVHTVPSTLIPQIAAELNQLKQQGMQEQHLTYMLRLLAQERQRSQEQRNSIDLVWTGEEFLGTESRDTRIVVKELFTNAQKSIVISSYALDTGRKAKELFEPLAQRMENNLNLQVHLFVNISRPYRQNDKSDATLIREFAETFRHKIWPGQRFPHVFYDPRALSKEIFPRACLHAKCIVVDDERLLITSANFTEAAHQRNIEAGVLLADPIVAKAMRSQFAMLVERKILCRIPGIHP
ncbi:MAG: DISARM system phospholipase D-like protein DrmC [Cyanobacteria bacterium J06639_14]